MVETKSLNLQLRRPLAAAIAWQLIAELTRRYAGTLSLRILEMHPAGGLYDLLTIWGTPDRTADVYEGTGEQLLGLNLLGDAHGQPSEDRKFEWLLRWLSAAEIRDVVDDLATFTGLPLLSRSAPTTRDIFGIRLIAAVLNAHALSRDPLDARMGFCDTSGYGSGVLPIVRDLVGSQFIRETDAARWWLIRRWLSNEPLAVISIDGWLVPASAPSQAIDLYSIFKDVREMEPVIRQATDVMAVSLKC